MLPKKRTAALLAAAAAVMAVTGCSVDKAPQDNGSEVISLTIWGPEESQDMLREMTEAFTEYYKDEAAVEVFIGVEAEDTLADNIKANPQNAADVFQFADDQMTTLLDNNVLLPITENAEEIIAANGGKDSPAVQCASRWGKLYACPLTASNGYFLFYNADYFSESDVETLDGILDAAERSGKYFSMDWSSGWYIYSFFGGAGFELYTAEDGSKNFCNWNETAGKYSGVQVARAMLDISARGCFLNAGNDEFVKRVQEGSVIAGVNGPWNAEKLKAAWGDAYRAAKLPTYTLAGEQVQMYSFMGYKLVGVNAYTENPLWATRLAEWISNCENQLKRFDYTGECPCNVEAAGEERVLSSQVAKALSAQRPFSIREDVAYPYWSPSSAFGTIMASGNPDGADLQMLLDDLVEQAQS